MDLIHLKHLDDGSLLISEGSEDTKLVSRSKEQLVKDLEKFFSSQSEAVQENWVSSMLFTVGEMKILLEALKK